MPPSRPKKPSAPQAASLDLSGLIACLVEAGQMFQFAFLPDEVEPSRRYAAQVNGKSTRASDSVSALLKALSLGVQSEEKAMKEAQTGLEAARKRIVSIRAAIPALEAHTPAGANREPCLVCGEIHSEEDGDGPPVTADSAGPLAALIEVMGGPNVEIAKRLLLKRKKKGDGGKGSN